MDYNKRNLINEIADDILNALNGVNISSPIGPQLNKVINALGGVLKETTESQIKIDGRLKKIDSNGFLIEFSEDQSKERKVFSIAHELGHLFLHMGYLIDNDRWNNVEIGQSYNRQGVGSLEMQANEFAAAILMPKNEYLQILSENRIGNKHYDLEPVAKHFGVSIDAAKNRGRWLGELKW